MNPPRPPRLRSPRRVALAAFVLLCAWALLAAAPAAAAPLSPALTVEAALRERIALLRTQPTTTIAGARIAAPDLLAAFYGRRAYAPAWACPRQRQSLADFVEQRSRAHGLEPADYHASALRPLLAKPAPAPQEAADRELLMSDALVRLVYHLYFGKADPSRPHGGWSFHRLLRERDPAQVLEALVATRPLGDAIENFAPRVAGYRDTMAALEHHRQVAQRGGWPIVPPGPALRQGVQAPRVARLRERLAASGDLAAEPADAARPMHFDAALAAGLQRFQSRHGLRIDGVAGSATVAAMNLDVQQRIAQLRVNLDRWRWVAQDLNGDFLLVNLAASRAELFLAHREVWSSPLDVDRGYRSTPSFRATLHGIVLNPSWSMPPGQLRDSLLPHLVRKPQQLAGLGLKLVDDEGQEWPLSRLLRSSGNERPYTVVQPPGPRNALGRLKFLLPNAHSVYLHDRPDPSRSGSGDAPALGGCIRIERSRELALLLLDQPRTWNLAALQAEIGKGATRTLAARRRVPVLVLRLTAVGDAGGSARFQADPHANDAAVLQALQTPFGLPAAEHRAGSPRSGR